MLHFGPSSGLYRVLQDGLRGTRAQLMRAKSYSKMIACIARHESCCRITALTSNKPNTDHL